MKYPVYVKKDDTDDIRQWGTLSAFRGLSGVLHDRIMLATYDGCHHSCLQSICPSAFTEGGIP